MKKKTEGNRDEQVVNMEKGVWGEGKPKNK